MTSRSGVKRYLASNGLLIIVEDDDADDPFTLMNVDVVLASDYDALAAENARVWVALAVLIGQASQMCEAHGIMSDSMAEAITAGESALAAALEGKP